MPVVYRYRGPYTGRYYYTIYSGPYYVGTTRDDTEILTDIEADLILDSWVDATNVNVEVNEGVVTLSGNVDTVVAKRSAGDDAWDTPGVVDVINNLKVQR